LQNGNLHRTRPKFCAPHKKGCIFWNLAPAAGSERANSYANTIEVTELCPKNRYLTAITGNGRVTLSLSKTLLLLMALARTGAVVLAVECVGPPQGVGQMSKQAWLTGLVGAVALLAGIPAAQALSTNQYAVTVQEGDCLGNPAKCAAGNGSQNPLTAFSGAPITFIWTSSAPGGGLNFNLPTGGLNTIQGFLNTGSGSISNLSVQAGFSLNDLLSAGGFAHSTQFIFNQVVVAANSGIIQHDDGILLDVNGAPITPASAANPTTSIPTAYSITAGMIGGSANLYYVAANNLPEVLNSPAFGGVVPLPATAWLFGGGLGGLIMLARRRRRSMTA
jgi:hypothetical protein